MTIAVDIDDTLIVCEKKKCHECGRVNYAAPRPIQKEIDMINRLHDSGKYRIHLWTGRGEDALDLTVEQLSEMGIRYHKIKFGKFFDAYIDKNSAYKTVKEFLHENEVDT